MSKIICHLTSVHYPFDTRIFYKECKTLSTAGYDVVLIAQNNKDEVVEGVTIKGVDKPKNRMERMTKTVSWVYKRALEVDADVYHFHDPELIFTGLKLKKRGKKVIYDVHEDVPRQILSKGWIPLPLRGFISWLAEKVEDVAGRRFDCILTATPYIRDRFLKINHNTLDINNYPLLQELYLPEVDWSKKEKTVCYVGGITKERGILQMVDAVKKSGYKLFLAGSFVSQQLRMECFKREGWSNVVELGFLNRGEVKNVLAKSMAGLVLLHPTNNYIDALPIKMFEYMSAGIPVIASHFPLWKEIVEGNSCGICVDPLNVEEIAEAIRWLIENPDVAQKMGENGRRAVEEKYNWSQEAEKLLKIYEELLS